MGIWRFQLLGFPVTVEPWFWLVIVVLGARPGSGIDDLVTWVLAAFVSILIHELGHAFTARGFGLHPSITLHGIGGHTTMPGRPLSHQKNILVSLAGSAAQLVLAVALYFGITALPYFELPLLYLLIGNLITVSFYWALLNLLPILPMDGGHVMYLGIQIAKKRRDEVLPRQISTAVAIIVGILALYFGQTYLALLFGLMIYQNITELQQHSSRW